MSRSGEVRVRRTEIVPGPTVRQQIENGPRFIAEPGTCLACGGFGEDECDQIDKSTGLGPHCWANWRWSPVAEYQVQRTRVVE